MAAEFPELEKGGIFRYGPGKEITVVQESLNSISDLLSLGLTVLK